MKADCCNMNIAHAPRKTSRTDGIYCPEGFDPDRYPGPIAEHPDASRWLLNCIYFRRVTLNLDPSEYVNLHYDLLEIVMGDVHYIKPIREAMIAYGLIECDGHWEKGRNSLGFRIGPALHGSNWKIYTSTNKRFLKRVERFRSYETTPTGFVNPVHDHLASWASQITIDPGYEVVLDGLKPSKKGLAPHQVDLIERGFLRLSVCEYGRFHSNFTGLCRELRPYLRVNDCPLVEVDIVNSQPYFLSMLLLENALSQVVFKSSTNVFSLSDLVFDTMLSLSSKPSLLLHEREGRERGDRQTPYDIGFSESEGKSSSCSLSSMSSLLLPEREEREQGERHTPYVWSFLESEGKPRSVLDLVPSDLRQFIMATTQGTFYESFDLGQHDRERLKPMVFQVLYGDRKTMNVVKLSQAFRERYPTVWDMLLRLKSDKGYAWVGRELQRRESAIVIGGVCGLLASDYAHVPIVTVHDSVLTTPDHLDLVTGLLRQELGRNYYGPRLRTKT